MHGFDGVEFYPTVVAKAAALLHALASTQGFIDGNKRTAWLACVAFMRLHGLRLVDADSYAYELVLDLAEGRSSVNEAQEWLLKNLND